MEMAGLAAEVDLPHQLEERRRVGRRLARRGRLGRHHGRRAQAQVDRGLPGGARRFRGRRRDGRGGGARAGGHQVLTQGESEVGGALVPLLDLLRHRLLEDRQQRLVLGALRQRVGRLVVGDLVERLHQAVGLERLAPDDQLEEHRPYAEHVAAAVDLGALDLLGRHVVGRSEDDAGGGHGGGGESGDAEVHDLHRAVLTDEDVGGLDVAVDDAGLVGVGQPVQHLQDDRHLAVEGERDPQAQRLEEVLPLEQLHGDVRRAVGVVPQVEDEHHVGVHELGHRPRLPLEAVLLLGIGGELPEHDLERDVPVEERVVGVIHHPHGSLAQGTHDVVLADALRGVGARGAIRRRCGIFAQGIGSGGPRALKAFAPGVSRSGVTPAPSASPGRRWPPDPRSRRPPDEPPRHRDRGRPRECGSVPSPGVAGPRRADPGPARRGRDGPP